MRAYSQDLRVRVLADVDSGLPTKSVADKYRVSESWVRRLKQRRRETGEITPRSCRNHRQSKLTPHLERLQKHIAERPDATLDELRRDLRLSVSKSTLCRALQQLRLTIKKKSCTPRNKIGLTSRSAGPGGWPTG
jgi:transposase